MAVSVKAEHADGTNGYYVDCVVEGVDSCFQALCKTIFGDVPLKPGAFILTDLGVNNFHIDHKLQEFLFIFDEISAQGFIKTLRLGDTGIGYTFESKAGIPENNSKEADYKG